MLAVAGGGVAPPTCSVFCSVVRPVSTAAALIVALRVKPTAIHAFRNFLNAPPL